MSRNDPKSDNPVSRQSNLAECLEHESHIITLWETNIAIENGHL